MTAVEYIGRHQVDSKASRYLDDLLNIDNIYFDQMVDRIYPTGLQLNRTNSSDTEAPFLDLNLRISNGTVSTKINDKRDDFVFDIVNFPFLDGDVPRRTSYWVYISQLIRFARASSNLNDFNYRNKALTAKLLRQGYRYFKLRKAFSKFYRRHSALLEIYSVSLKTLLQQGISEPKFYGDLGGPGVSLTLCCFVVYSTRRFVVCLSMCHFVLVFFSPFSIAITSLGEERANLSGFVGGVWEGRLFVIVALPGLFSYLF